MRSPEFDQIVSVKISQRHTNSTIIDVAGWNIHFNELGLITLAEIRAQTPEPFRLNWKFHAKKMSQRIEE
jgi:hypothetical protein